MIIARVESFITGETIFQALKRAEMYLKAGADAILIHSKSKEPKEIFDFSAEQRANSYTKPLIVGPTTYYKVTTEDLKQNFVNAVIYANQILRASVKAANSVMLNIIRTGSTSSVENQISSLKEIFELTGTDKLLA